MSEKHTDSSKASVENGEISREELSQELMKTYRGMGITPNESLCLADSIMREGGDLRHLRQEKEEHCQEEPGLWTRVKCSFLDADNEACKPIAEEKLCIEATREYNLKRTEAFFQCRDQLKDYSPTSPVQTPQGSDPKQNGRDRQ